MEQVIYTPETMTALADAGEKFARTDVDRAFALHQFMRAVGEAPTFDQWNTARAQAIIGYRRTKPQANDDACNTWWSRMLKALRTYADESGFEFKVPAKPKSDNPEAEKKAAQRANPFEGQAPEVIQAEIARLTGIGDKDSVKLALKAHEALGKMAREAQKTASKAEADALKPRRDTVAKAVKAAPAHVLALLEAVIDLSAENASAEAKARAWAVLQAVAPKAKPEPAKMRKAA